MTTPVAPFTTRLKKFFYWRILPLAALALVVAMIWYLWGVDAQQRFYRSAVNARVNGHYSVTYTNYNTVKVWDIKSGKITTEPDKGYYFFYVDDLYVQTPIALTVIEEVK